VLENTESTQRQYNLRDQAVALGWSAEQLRIIDSDLGKSGAERDRDGFQQLITDVSLGRAGIVMGLEVRAWLATRWTGIGCSNSAP
jgi:DNA invertase Pin-like site-specific DNA recombinase